MSTGNRAVGAAALILFTVLPLGVGGVLLWIRHSALRDTDAARFWAETPCIIESSEFDSSEDGGGLDLVYRYEFDGQVYTGDRLDLMIGSMGDDDVFEKEIYEGNPPGATAVCYVDPNDPANSVFDREHALGAVRRLWLLAFPFVAVGVGFACLIITGVVSYFEERRRSQESAPVVESIGPPPRRVPLLGGIMALAGPSSMRLAWGLSVGFLFVFVIMDGPASYARLFGRPLESEVSGRITDVRPERGHEMGVPVFRYTFTYEVDGQSLSGQSFTRGAKYKEGDAVTVAYDADNPAKGSIAGARTSTFTWWHSLIPLGVLLLFALGLVGMGWHSLKALWLFRSGVLTRAKRMGTSLAAQRQEGQTATLLSDFYFDVQGNMQQARHFGHENRKTRRRRRSHEEPDEVWVLYHPRKPKNNVILAGELEQLLLRRHSLAGFLMYCAPPVLAAAGVAYIFRG